MSIERQRYILEQQERDILDGLAELKANHGERFSIKQLERARKSIQAKLEKLNDQSRKDDVVTFEELGVDRLFIDEAHYYKNLAAFSKMRNVGGISQTEAQKSSDLFMKCRYLDELTGRPGRGVCHRHTRQQHHGGALHHAEISPVSQRWRSTACSTSTHGRLRSARP